MNKYQEILNELALLKNEAALELDDLEKEVGMQTLDIG